MRKFTLFMMSLFLMLGTAMAQNYSLTETGISSGELLLRHPEEGYKSQDH